MLRIISASMIILMLTACIQGTIPLAVVTSVITPSPSPAILSPTPVFIPSVTLVDTSFPISQTPSETSTIPTSPTPPSSPSPTIIPSLTPLPSFTPSVTPGSELTLDIIGCNTSVDILHNMGEVTNAFPVIRNISSRVLTNVCASLTASDEARVHPDKAKCISTLPAGYQVILKLTVDTGLGQDTGIEVKVNTIEGPSVSNSRSSCRDIGLPGWVPAKVDQIEAIP
jgi:hypothetical protein